MDKSFIEDSVSKNDFLISEHAHQERQEEQITVAEIKQVLLKGEVLEEYPKDPRGKSCLVAGKANDRVIHVVCGKRISRLLIVTVYLPKKPTWLDWKTRSREVIDRV